MSHVHFQYAKEIERILKISMGLTRRALYDAINIPDKNELRFGEVLAELCQGKTPVVTMVKPPGAFTVYYHNGSAPPLAEARTWVPRPAVSAAVKTTPAHKLEKWRPKKQVRKCGCGAEMPYNGRGRPPVMCKACRQQAAKPSMIAAEKILATRVKEFCTTCGCEIIYGGWGPKYTQCRRCRKAAAKKHGRCPMCGHLLNKPMNREPA